MHTKDISVYKDDKNRKNHASCILKNLNIMHDAIVRIVQF